MLSLAYLTIIVIFPHQSQIVVHFGHFVFVINFQSIISVSFFSSNSISFAESACSNGWSHPQVIQGDFIMKPCKKLHIQSNNKISHDIHKFYSKLLMAVQTYERPLIWWAWLNPLQYNNNLAMSIP